MNLEPRILQASDLEQIYQLEKTQSQTGPDDFQAEILSWSAPWRQEALSHYLPMGWSFGLFENDLIKAYALAQPQLFVHGLTQNLWVEHLFYNTEEEAQALLDLLYRTCREKHFQTLRLKDSSWVKFLPISVKPLDDKTEVHTFKTAKL